MSKQRTPKMYGELAPRFHLVTHPKSYRGEAAWARQQLLKRRPRERPTMLELGSGGGNNALHLKKHFRLTLTDLSPEMLALSATINPECEHIRGDMRTLRLGRQFDFVFVHDAICYMTTAPDLRRAVETCSCIAGRAAQRCCSRITCVKHFVRHASAAVTMWVSGRYVTSS